ncbi:MAG: 1-(5-phosphoribosyl)-5-[(5-phosphoribosylamino)methylideneamino]imidazole-4-carboxamide isomerase [Acidobacteriota bacterium]
MIEIIPAIDLIDGKCVRLSQGDFAKQDTYDGEPLEMAKKFEASGLKRLHMVDLDGAKTGSRKNMGVLEKIASNTSLTVDFGGGIKTDKDVVSVFDAGARMASIGTIAANAPEQFAAWINTYGCERFLLGSDVKDKKVAVNGWTTVTELDIVPFLKSYMDRGVDNIFVTDIAKDGLLAGPAADLYAELLGSLPGLKLIASGGVRDIRDIRELERIGCSGVIVGKAIYEKRVSLGELSAHNTNAG